MQPHRSHHFLAAAIILSVAVFNVLLPRFLFDPLHSQASETTSANTPTPSPGTSPNDSQEYNIPATWPPLEVSSPRSGEVVSERKEIKVYAPRAVEVKAFLRNETLNLFFDVGNLNLVTTTGSHWSVILDNRRYPSHEAYTLAIRVRYTTSVGNFFAYRTLPLSLYQTTTTPSPTATATSTATPSPTPTTASTTAPSPSHSPTPASSTSPTPKPTGTEAPNLETARPTASATAKPEPTPISTLNPVERRNRIENIIADEIERQNRSFINKETDQAKLKERRKQAVEALLGSINVTNIAFSTVTEVAPDPTPAGSTASVTPTPSAEPTAAPATPAIQITFDALFPEADVEIEIRSDPITIRTKADGNGRVLYTLTEPGLDPGKHTVTITVIDPSTSERMTKQNNFFISRAVAASTLNGKSLVLEDPNRQLLNMYLFSTILVILVALVSLIYLYRSKIRLAEPPSSPNPPTNGQ